MSVWCLPPRTINRASNVHFFRPSLSIATAYTYPRSRTSTPLSGIKHPPPHCSQPHTAVSSALYYLRLGTPILTSVQATANFLTLLVAPTNMRWHVFSSPDHADTHITVEDITRHDDHSTFVSRLPENLAGGAVCDVCDDGNDGEKVRISLHLHPTLLPRHGFLHSLLHRGFHIMSSKGSCTWR